MLECRPSLSDVPAVAVIGCTDCAVRGDALCGALDTTQDLEAMHRLGRRLQIPKGQTVVLEGDESLVVGNVIEGLLKLSVVSADGVEQIVGIAYPADFIGRPFGPSSGHSVTALVDSTLCVFPRRAFDAFTEEHPLLAQALLRRTLDDLDRARSWMVLLARKSAPARVASLLLDMNRRLARPGNPVVCLPLSRQQMADLLGLVIETVSRSMTSFKAAGLIDLPRGRLLEVRDLRGLERIASG